MKALNSLLIIAILLFATAMTWTYFAVRGDRQGSVPQAGIGGGPNDTNYRTQFSTLLVEHGNTAVMHLTDLYDGKDTSDTSQKLEDNTQRLGDVVKQLGTAADKDAFVRTFRGHIKEYENYTKARKENNQTAINLAKENLQMHAMDFGKLANKLMPTLSEQRATELMTEHINLTLANVDAHARGDTVKKLNEMKNANAQALKFADELGRAAEAASQ